MLFMLVVIRTAAGERIELPRGEVATIVDQRIEASWHGTSRLIPVGTVNGVAYQLSHNNVVNVRAGDLVRVTAGFDVYIRALHRGNARITFAPQPFGFNVPMVLLRIDS